MRPRRFVPALMVFLFAGCIQGTGVPNQVSPLPSEEQPPSLGEIDIGIPWRVENYWVQRAYYEDDPETTIATFDFHVEDTERVGDTPALRVQGDESQRTYWLRASDGALLKERDRDGEHLYDPPCESFLSAPKEGDSIEHACYRIGTKSINATRPTGALATQVVGTENVSVPAGRFDAVRLETKQDGATLITEYYATGACFPARVALKDGDRTLFLDMIAQQCGA